MATANAERIWTLVDERREAYEALSDRIWGMPEIAYTEFRSCEEHTRMLDAEGFSVTREPAGIPTAVIGEAGEGGPVIAFLGEYDALPGLSQEAGIDEHKPLSGNGQGHGCGHNLLGSAALLAATAYKNFLAENGLPGRVRYYGCPAEEGGAAKAFMVRDGLFDDVDAAITWHPASITHVDDARSLANTRLDFTFTGRASHAAMAPHLGRSALDAAELMSVGVNYLREHVPSDARIHYAYLDAGGIAPNVVQGGAKVRYAVRSRDVHGMKALNERVIAVAEGAAKMTGTRVEVRVLSAVSNLLGNTPMEQAMYANMERLGPVVFDDADIDYARRIQATLTEEDISSDYRRVGVKEKADLPLCDFVVPLDVVGEPMVGSTDVGDVSWAVPTVQARVATHAIGTPGHSWQITAQGLSPAAHKGMTYAAKVMAGTAVDLLKDPALLDSAKADHRERTAKTPYASPIPSDVKAPIQPRPNALAVDA